MPRCPRLFRGDPTGLCYYSLSADVNTIPDDVTITSAMEDSGVLMGGRHRKYTLEAMQYYPERIVSEAGNSLFRNKGGV